jgi:putative (di)nucleoside polyphosphate hydrolase
MSIRWADPLGDEFPDYRPCVGIVLVNPAGLVFAGRRIDMPAGLSAWQMPQGGIDPGETPRQAVLRELAEETGTDKAEILAESRALHRYDLPAGMIGQMWGGRYRGQKQRWFAIRFLGSNEDIDIATEHPEFEAWQWTAPAALLDLIVPFKRAIYAAVFDEFRDHLAR